MEDLSKGVRGRGVGEGGVRRGLRCWRGVGKNSCHTFQFPSSSVYTSVRPCSSSFYSRLP